MPRIKVKFALIENKTKREASYRRRQKGLFKKAYELGTLCGVEVAIVIYSPYHNQPYLYPNHAIALNTFKRFRELSVLDQSKHMMTGEDFTKQRIEKLEKQIYKLRKENRVKECTNMMHEVLKGNGNLAHMHPYDLNDLSYVIKKNLKQIRELMKAKIDGEGSTLNARQPMVLDGTSSEEPAPVSTIPSVARSTVPGATNIEGSSAHLLVPFVDPISVGLTSMAPHADPSMVPCADPLMVSPAATPRTTQTVPIIDQSRFPPPLSPSNSFKMFPEMVLQMCPPLSQETAFRRPPRRAPPVPPTTMASPIPSPVMTPSMSCSSVSSNNTTDGLFDEYPQ